MFIIFNFQEPGGGSAFLSELWQGRSAGLELGGTTASAPKPVTPAGNS